MMQEHIKKSLDQYAETGKQLGDFLIAVLSNDLFEAILRADHKNEKTMKDIVLYVYNDMPALCHGSKSKVEKWLQVGGMAGLEARSEERKKEKE